MPLPTNVCSSGLGSNNFERYHIPAITSGVRSWVRTGGSPVRVVEVVVPAIVRPVLEPGHQPCQQQHRGTSVILLLKMIRLIGAINTRTCDYKKLYIPSDLWSSITDSWHKWTYTFMFIKWCVCVLSGLLIYWTQLPVLLMFLNGWLFNI